MSRTGVIGLASAFDVPASAGAERMLVRALAAGDEGALRVAYRDHAAAVRAFARRLVGDDGEAEDLVHEVFVRLPSAARRFRGDASLRTLLVSMAVNHARQHVRAAIRRRAATERLARAQQVAPAPAVDPGERHALAQALTRALDALPLDQRVAFVLCEVDERPSAEAAALVGTRDGTMRARLLLAKKKLRALLQEAGFSSEGEGGNAPAAAQARGR
jgi:RNA polymerase sigma-70 factor (ECF subfamily)